jgi:hypothetical protein
MPLESSEPCLYHWSLVSLRRCYPSQVSLVDCIRAKLGSLMASEPSEPLLMPLESSEPLPMSSESSEPLSIPLESSEPSLMSSEPSEPC